MNDMRVMTVVGTRPEIIRLSRVIDALDRWTSHVLVHTGQNYDYELNQVFFDDLGIRRPDHFLDSAGDSPAETIGRVISRIEPVILQTKPDALLILGDTNSSLAAITAKRHRIPVFHMEAGNRCFDERVPEEINRRIVDHISDINLPYSDIAREYLLREGLPPDRIIKTGSPMYEVIHHYWPSIDRSGILQQLGLQQYSYFVLSAHREENVDSPERLNDLLGTLNAVAETYGLPIVVSTHPRTRKRIDVQGLPLHPLVRLEKPLGFLDYVKLQTNARVVLSDSGTITEESSILNFPAVNLRDAHERPEGMEEASVVLSGLTSGRVLRSIAVVEHQTRGSNREFSVVRDYAVPNVSEKVVRIILSYTDYVRQRVWHGETRR